LSESRQKIVKPVQYSFRHGGADCRRADHLGNGSILKEIKIMVLSGGLNMMERNDKRYSKLIRQICPVLVRRYGESGTEKFLRHMQPVYSRFLEETLFIDGKGNIM